MNADLSIHSPLKRLYFWVMKAADKPGAIKTLAVISFLESSVFPIPPDIMLIAMVLANRAKAWLLAAVCSISSILGGILGYALGYFLFESVGQWIIDTYSLQVAFDGFRQTFQEWGFWIIMAKGLTPIPYKLVTIASGVCELSFIPFLVASIITRTGRFFLVSSLVWYFGEWARTFIEKYLGLILLAFLGAIGVGVYIIKGF